MYLGGRAGPVTWPSGPGQNQTFSSTKSVIVVGCVALELRSRPAAPSGSTPRYRAPGGGVAAAAQHHSTTMTNLTVLRTAQHAGWPGYCWPFPGNGFPLTSPSSPSVPNMANSSPCRPPSPAHLRSPPSPTQLQRLSRAYEEHFLQLTAAAAAASAGHSHGGGVKVEPLSPDPVTLTNKDIKSSNSNKDVNHSSSGKNKTKQNRSSPAQLAVSSVANDNTSSPSASPKSQSSARTKTPVSFSGTPPHPSFTPPIGLPPACFNAAALGGLSVPSSVGVGNLPRASHFLEPPALPRNCSDLMRSLAAKYHNNNNNELFASQMNKSFPRLGMNSLMPVKAGYSPPINSTQHAEESHGDSVSPSKGSPSKLFSPFMPHSSVNEIHQSPVSSHSSAKALMDLVRNSSGSKPSLDTATHPLNSSVKRYAESSSPLDLSSGDSAKRIRHDFSINNTTPFTSKHDLLSESHLTAVDFEKNIPDVRLSPDCVSKDRMSQAVSPTLKFKDNSAPNTRPSHADTSMVRDSSILDARLSPKLNSPRPQDSPQNDGIRNSVASHVRTSDILLWTVEDVCAFVKSIDLCAEYADMFAEERIDGWCLSLLTETHLTCNLGLKLGPALKLRSLLASMTVPAEGDGTPKCGGCRTGNMSWNSKDGRGNRCNKSNEDGSMRDAVASDPDIKRSAVSSFNNNIQSKSSPGRHEHRMSCSSENTQPSPSRFSCESPSTPHGELKISSPSLEDNQYFSVSRDSKSSSPS
ncbi:Sterile alpha motif domain [Trinorchestia longiramus]|nr:Sterile alpha motif domain [Trinorchestia longiramus]